MHKYLGKASGYMIICSDNVFLSLISYLFRIWNRKYIVRFDKTSKTDISCLFCRNCNIPEFCLGNTNAMYGILLLKGDIYWWSLLLLWLFSFIFIVNLLVFLYLIFVWLLFVFLPCAGLNPCNGAIIWNSACRLSISPRTSWRMRTVSKRLGTIIFIYEVFDLVPVSIRKKTLKLEGTSLIANWWENLRLPARGKPYISQVVVTQSQS